MRKQVPNQEQIIEALDLAEMGLTAEQAYKIGRLTGDMISSAFALGRVAAAEDVDQMPITLGAGGWNYLAKKAEEAGSDPRRVWRRHRSDDFTAATIETAYQYGYREAAKVARGVTRPKPVETHAFEPAYRATAAERVPVDACGRVTFEGDVGGFCTLPADHPVHLVTAPKLSGGVDSGDWVDNLDFDRRPAPCCEHHTNRPNGLPCDGACCHGCPGGES